MVVRRLNEQQERTSGDLAGLCATCARRRAILIALNAEKLDAHRHHRRG
jgi:hypothetical protein